ncbi:hypothetical protein [Actinoplanes utahensis]|uniref:Restriction endonuclease type IV Mrr domain-containing protein n=1 Tax=Actinoplanes utahensis TaxID=1869 RepID=A0A0A6UHB2_ACTUT|nr:hypothetical protein [Actinoplanes utahensis]KHD74483.1 hypothetical protein MB27_28615 [Actinoplanes utahensis]GIF31457.1 hypothetical protein Aut01nite_44430 [Actinoplanes utahensis]
MYLKQFLRLVLGAMGTFFALLSVYAVVTAVQGDDSGATAAVFFGIAAVVAFALPTPVSWLAGKVVGVIAPPLRRALAAVPRPRWKIRSPRFGSVRRAGGVLPAILAASTGDGIGLLSIVSGPDDPPADWTPGEMAAEQHMRAHGFPDARLTEPRFDEGVDIVAETAVARVTTQEQQVSVPMVRRLRDTLPDLASHLFYSTAGYTKITVATADKIGVSLFLIDAHRAVVPVNTHARRISP